MLTLLQQTLNGLTLGSIYALIALGYTMVYGVLKLINFAHGEVFMIGAMVGYFAAFLLGLSATPTPVGLLIVTLLAMGFCGVLGVTIERVAYRPLRSSPRLSALITAIGVSLFLQYTLQINYTTLTSPEIGDYGDRGRVLRVAYQPPGGAWEDVYAGWIRHDVAEVQVEPGARQVSTDQPQVEVPASQPLALRATPAPARPWLLPLPAAGDAAGVGAASGWTDPQPRSGGTYRVSLSTPEPAVVKIVGPEKKGMPRFLTDPDTGREYPSVVLLGTAERGVVMRPIDLVILPVTALMLAGLWYLTQRTATGRAIRAVSFDKDIAALMGIHVDRTISLTFFIGSVLAGAAGVLVAARDNSLDPLMGAGYGLKAFVAAVLGGIGSLPGAALGGLLLGLIESYVQYYLDPDVVRTGLSGWLGPDTAQAISAWVPEGGQWKEAVAFAILIGVLLVRPAGLLGRKAQDKV